MDNIEECREYVIGYLWYTQLLCIGIVLEEKVKNIASFEVMEEVLDELNDSTANSRWQELKARVPLSDEFITLVKTYTQRSRFERHVPVSEEDTTRILTVYETVRSIALNKL